MRVLLLALGIVVAVASTAAVFAIWPVVADAPWEDGAPPAPTVDRIAEIRCAAALELRNTVEVTMSASRQERFTQNQLEELLSKAEREIDRYC